MRTRMAALTVSALLVLAACGKQPAETPASAPVLTEKQQYAAQRVGIYAPFRLTTDVSAFSPGKREMIKLLIGAAGIMDGLFWRQAWGDKAALLNSIDNEATRRLAVMNYGPWDRLAGDRSFVDGIEDKPLGANLYPRDMSKEEFEAAETPSARFAKSLDRFQPPMQNLASGGGSWTDYNVSEAQIEERVGRKIAHRAPALWSYARARISAFFAGVRA